MLRRRYEERGSCQRQVTKMLKCGCGVEKEPPISVVSTFLAVDAKRKKCHVSNSTQKPFSTKRQKDDVKCLKAPKTPFSKYSLSQNNLKQMLNLMSQIGTLR